MKFSRYMHIAHRWIGLALGVQVLLWMASGFIMSWYHITLVRGETNAVTIYAPELEPRSYANPGGVIAQLQGATSVKLKNFLEQPVYEVVSDDETAMFDAATGEKITPLPEDVARRVAKRDFIGEGELVMMEILTKAPQEYGRAVPVWRASFDDKLHTRLYISPQTGEVAARRNDVWRLYDFFWMLHIMDYEERKDFNNPLVKVFAFTGVLFAITGIYLIIVDFMRGRFLPGRRRRRNSGQG